MLFRSRAGRVRGLAVSSAVRSRAAPDLPTMDEAGVKGFDMTAWSGVIAPAGIPAGMVARIHAETSRVLAVSAIRDKLLAMGLEATGSTPEQFSQFIRDEARRWSGAVKAAGIQPE